MFGNINSQDASLICAIISGVFLVLNVLTTSILKRKTDIESFCYQKLYENIIKLTYLEKFDIIDVDRKVLAKSMRDKSQSVVDIYQKITPFLDSKDRKM